MTPVVLTGANCLSKKKISGFNLIFGRKSLKCGVVKINNGCLKNIMELISEIILRKNVSFGR